MLTRAFGVPTVLAEVLRDVDGITAAYIYGSWAARHEGQAGQRPVGDIDVLVLGEPDRDQLYAALGAAEQRLARPMQATIRDSAWLESGSGAFHDTMASRRRCKQRPQSRQGFLRLLDCPRCMGRRERRRGRIKVLR